MRRWALFPVVAVAAVLAWWLWPPAARPADRSPEVLPRPAPIDPTSAGTPSPALDAGAAAAAETALEVHVVEEETGAAIPGARVVLLSGPQLIVDERSVVREWHADAHGVARVQLTAGAVLEATAEGHVWSPSAEGAALAAPAVTLRCRRGVPVRGVVVDPRGRPLPQIEVSAENASLRTVTDLPPRHTFDRARTDAAGRFQLWVLEGKVVVCWGGGLWRQTDDRFMTPVAPLRLVVEPAFAVRGRVLGADGGEAAFALVRSGGSGAATADEHGQFELGALEDPKQVLEAVSADEAERSPPVAPELRLGAWTEVELQLQRTLRVEGVVTDAAGHPVPGAFLTMEQVEGDGDGLAMTPADWTGGSGLRSGPRGELSLDTHTLDPGATFEVLAWTRGAQGFVRAKGGQRVELVLREAPMVTGTVTDPEGRPLPHFVLGFTPVDSADGTFAVARSALDDELAVRAAGYAETSVPLPDGGAALGRLSLARTHLVHLQATVEGREPHDVRIDDAPLDHSPDGGWQFEARLPSQVVWVTGSGFLSRTVEVGGDDQVLRLELSPGGRLLVHLEPPVAEPSWFDLLDCAPPRAPFDRARLAWPSDGGLVLSGLAPGRCRLATSDGRWEGSLRVDLPGEGTEEVTMTLTRSAPRPPGPGFLPQLRGSSSRPHQPR